MFDSVGAVLDETARTRERRVALGGTLVGGSLAALASVLGLWAAAPPPPPAPGPEAPVVEYAVVDLGEAMSAPSPPARGGGSRRAAAGDADAQAAPEPVPDDPAPLDQVHPVDTTEPLPGATDATVTDGSSDGGDGPSDGTGTGNGLGDGDGDGRGDGDGDGDGDGGPTVTYDQPPEVRSRSELDYPVAARGLGLGEQVCRAHVRLSDRGVPVDVRVEACPAVFQARVVEGLSSWRWYPAKARGQRVPSTFTVKVRFVEK
ncbi:MAG: hypothetical protein H6733_15995 [Alphaproteobacteria bacterium]|nr:hypothetical protein [Alphaproteobacteria bacterium]